MADGVSSSVTPWRIELGDRGCWAGAVDETPLSQPMMRQASTSGAALWSTSIQSHEFAAAWRAAAVQCTAVACLTWLRLCLWCVLDRCVGRPTPHMRARLSVLPRQPPSETLGPSLT